MITCRDIEPFIDSDSLTATDLAAMLNTTTDRIYHLINRYRDLKDRADRGKLTDHEKHLWGYYDRLLDAKTRSRR